MSQTVISHKLLQDNDVLEWLTFTQAVNPQEFDGYFLSNGIAVNGKSSFKDLIKLHNSGKFDVVKFLRNIPINENDLVNNIHWKEHLEFMKKQGLI